MVGDNCIGKRKTKWEGMDAMAEDNDSRNDKEKSQGLTTSVPEGQVYQKLYLCDYLRELEDSEQDGERAVEKKKELSKQAINPLTHEESS